jgi:hypothetical protein
MPRRGKQAGSRALCCGQKSYWTTYTLQSAEYGKLSVPVAVVRTYQRRRSGRRQLRWLLYVVLGVDGPLVRVRRRYRRRFGIETGYRLMEAVRARTTSTTPALRFLLMGVALKAPPNGWRSAARCAGTGSIGRYWPQNVNDLEKQAKRSESAGTRCSAAAVF